MTSATLVWDPRFLDYDLGPGHPFSERSRGLAASLLDLWSAGPRPLGLDRCRQVEPASRSELLRFHTPEYLARVQAYDEEGSGRPLDLGDTPSFPRCHEAASRLVGGTLAAVRSTLGGGPRRAFQPGGGLHHAAPDHASGFCIFNDLAVAIADAFARGARHVAYVDVDAHHGDGVMYGFYGDGRLLDIDFHESGRTLFPGTGEPYETGVGDGAGSKVNVPMPAGAGDAALTRLFDRLVPGLVRAHRPELIVLQLGVDGHAGDALGHLRYTTRGYDHVVRTLRGLADSLGSRLVVTGGGGYDASNVARVLALAGALLAGADAALPTLDELPRSWRDRFTEETGASAPLRLFDPAPATRPPEAAAPWEARLLTDLEGALGERFPDPAE